MKLSDNLLTLASANHKKCCELAVENLIDKACLKHEPTKLMQMSKQTNLQKCISVLSTWYLFTIQSKYQNLTIIRLFFKFTVAYVNMLEWILVFAYSLCFLRNVVGSKRNNFKDYIGLFG